MVNLRRYIDWAITTPLLILNLGLLAGEDMVLVAAVMGADIAMIFSGYMGSGKRQRDIHPHKDPCMPGKVTH